MNGNECDDKRREMTVKEAYWDLARYAARSCYDGTNALSSDTLLIAMQSILKQIPQKPIINDNKINCPRCVVENSSSRELELWMIYCPDCGQKIDWSGWNCAMQKILLGMLNSKGNKYTQQTDVKISAKDTIKNVNEVIYRKKLRKLKGGM